MKNAVCVRFHRRCIIKNFGSCRNLLIWALSVFMTVVLLDHYVFYQPSSEDLKGLPSHNNEAASSQTNTSCGQAEKCLDGQYSYQVMSGFNRESHPLICFNGNEIFSPKMKNGKRGLNLVTINGKTMKVEDIRTFDTYEDDTIFQRYFRLGIDSNNIVLMASNDEASMHLSDDSKSLISSFGSKQISNLQFRDSFVMIGQRNLKPPAFALEQLMKRIGHETFATPAIIKGCVSIPLGEVSQESQVVQEKEDKKEAGLPSDQVKMGDFSPNCGMEELCKPDQYPIRLFTGKKNEVMPTICFKGKYVLGDKLNNPGRGVIVGVFDMGGGGVVKIERFDTYQNKDNSAKMVKFLEQVKVTEVIFALAHDEAQTALTPEAKAALTAFGSSFITNLEFRNVWVFVGRPKLGGFSPYEDIEPSGKDSWPFPIDAKFCIDKKFEGTKDKLDLDLKKNMKKRNFCKKYDGYEEFCTMADIDKHPVITPQSEDSMKGHAIYNVPIVIVPGLSQVSVLMQINALLTNPGINVDMINVMYDEKFEESNDVCKLYKINATKLPSSTKYNHLIHSALAEVWKLYPQSDSVILLEEEVIPTHDLLFFLGQCLKVLQSDDTLAGVSAFNENGFKDLSSEPSLVYRGKTFPGFGLLLKKSFYQKTLKDQLPTCCTNRSWFGWALAGSAEVLYPDVSRVSRRNYLGLTEHASFLRDYLNSPREVYRSTQFMKLSGLDNLDRTSYTKTTNHLLSKASPIPNNLLVKCLNLNNKLQLTSGSTHVVYYERSTTSTATSSDISKNGNKVEVDPLLVKLATCFGISYAQYSHVRGKHEETLRFQYKRSQVMLVSDASPFFKSKLINQPPFTKQLLL